MKSSLEASGPPNLGATRSGDRAGRSQRSVREGFLVALALTGIMATLVGVVTAWVLLGRTEALVQESAARDVQRQVSQHLTDVLSAEQLTSPLSMDLHAKVDRQVRENFLSEDLIRVKVWSPDGRVLYSNIEAQEGETTNQNEGVNAAMKGRAWWEVGRVESALDQGKGTLMEVYVPIAPTRDRPPVAVAEAYVRYEPYAGMLGELRQSVALAGLIIFLTLPLGLFVLYRAVGHDIVQQRDLATQRLREVDALNRLMQRDIAYALDLREGVLALRREVTRATPTPLEVAAQYPLLTDQIRELATRAEAFLETATRPEEQGLSIEP